MADIIDFKVGGYRYIKGVFQRIGKSIPQVRRIGR